MRAEGLWLNGLRRKQAEARVGFCFQMVYSRFSPEFKTKMPGKMLECSSCRMWEIRETSGIPDDNTCKRCIQLQLLEKRVRELEKELDDLRLIRENEMYIDSSFRDVVTPKQQSTGNWVTVRRGNGTVEGQAEQVSPVDIPLHNRFTELDTVVGNALPGTSCDSRNSDTESGSTAHTHASTTGGNRETQHNWEPIINTSHMP